MQKYKFNVGFFISAILFLLASFVDEKLNLLFLSLSILFLVIFLANLDKEKNNKNK